MGGSMVTTDVAAIQFQLIPVVAKKFRVPIGSGLVICLLNTSGNAALFQLKTNANMADTMMPGSARGMMILKAAYNLLAPSTMADSSSSTGMS